MAVPKRKPTNRIRKQRRLQKFYGTFKPKQLVVCSNCKKLKLPHLLCLTCKVHNNQKINYQIKRQN